MNSDEHRWSGQPNSEVRMQIPEVRSAEAERTEKITAKNAKSAKGGTQTRAMLDVRCKMSDVRSENRKVRGDSGGES